MTTRLQTLSYVAFVALVVALSTFSIVNLDVGFHLAAGKYILQHGAIPTHDPFSFIAEGRPWVDSHWLFQVMLQGVYSIASAPGLVVLRIGLVVWTFALLVAVARRRAGVPLALVVGLLAVFVSYQRFIIRPELLTLLFLAIFVYGVDGLARHPRRFLIVLPIVQVLWVNSHGLYVLGLGYVGLHLLGGLAQDFAHRRWPRVPAPGQGAGQRRHEALLLALCAATAVLNANGVDGILYPVHLLVELSGGVWWFPQLLEMQSPFAFPILSPLDPRVFFVALVVLFLSSSIVSWKSARLADLLPALVFGVLALRAYRNLPLFAIVAVPVTAAGLDGAWWAAIRSGRIRRPDPRKVAWTTAAGMLALVVAVSAGAVTNRLYTYLDWPRRFGFGESPYYPSGLIEPLRALEGRFFNDSSMGGYLIWKLYPDKQVAFDGRWEVYGELLLSQEAAMQGPRQFSAFARQHGITAIALLRKASDTARMMRWLPRSREFRLALQTPTALLFTKVEPRAGDQPPPPLSPPAGASSPSR